MQCNVHWRVHRRHSDLEDGHEGVRRLQQNEKDLTSRLAYARHLETGITHQVWQEFKIFTHQYVRKTGPGEANEKVARELLTERGTLWATCTPGDVQKPQKVQRQQPVTNSSSLTDETQFSAQDSRDGRRHQFTQLRAAQPP